MEHRRPADEPGSLRTLSLKPSDRAPTPDVTGDSARLRKRESAVVAAIIAAHLCLTIPLGLWLNVWIDEYYALLTTSKDLKFALDHTVTFQGHPPFFYVTLWAWRQISSSIEFARMFSVIVVAATLWIVHLGMRLWFPKLPTPWVVLPLAFNPWMIYAATEVRMYCLIPFWAAVLLFFFHQAFVAEPNRVRAQINFLLAATLGIYTFYYVGFMLPGGALALLIWRKWLALRNYILWMALCGILIFPQFVMSLGDTKLYTDSLRELPSLVRAAEFSLARVVDSVSGIFQFPEMLRLSLFALIVGTLTAGALIRLRHWDLRSAAIPLICMTVVLGYFALIRYVMGENIFFRHFVGAIIPLHMTIVAVADRFGSRRKAVLAAFMAVLLLICASASFIRFKPLAKIGDYRDVAAYLESHEQTGEPIVVAANHAVYPLREYYAGPNEFIPIPGHDDLETYDVAKWRIDNPQQVVDALADIDPGEHFWVFTDREPDAEWAGNALNFFILEEVLAEGFELESEQQFYGAKVRRYQRK